MFDAQARFNLSAFFLMVFTALGGGVYVVTAWIEVVRESRAKANWGIPAALYPFTIAVVLHQILLVYFASTPGQHPRPMEAPILWLSIFAASFSSLLVSMALVRRDSGPGTGSVVDGSKLLVKISVVLFIGLVTGFSGVQAH